MVLPSVLCLCTQIDLGPMKIKEWTVMSIQCGCVSIVMTSQVVPKPVYVVSKWLQSASMYQILLFTQVLGGYKNPNTKLISLNLTGNKIADPGAKALANVSSHSHTLVLWYICVPFSCIRWNVKYSVPVNLPLEWWKNISTISVVKERPQRIGLFVWTLICIIWGTIIVVYMPGRH